MNEVLSSITIDAEFEKLIPIPAEDERKDLDTSVQAEGIRDSLVVWDNSEPDNPNKLVLLDGHNRYKLAQKYDLKPSIIKRHFDSREDAKLWIIKNQLARRNLNAYQVVRLKGEEENILETKRKAKERQFAGLKQNQNTVLSKVDKTEEKPKPINTRNEIAKATGFSTGKVAQAQYVEKHAPEEIKHKAETGEIGIHEAYRQTKLSELPPTPMKPKDYAKEAREAHETFKEEKKENVVSFQKVQEDNSNLRTMAMDFTGKIMRASQNLSGLNLTYKASIDDVANALKPNERQNILTAINNAIGYLEQIREKVSNEKG